MIGLRMLKARGVSARDKLPIRPDVFATLQELARDGDERAVAYLRIVKPLNRIEKFR